MFCFIEVPVSLKGSLKGILLNIYYPIVLNGDTSTWIVAELIPEAVTFKLPLGLKKREPPDAVNESIVTSVPPIE